VRKIQLILLSGIVLVVVILYFQWMNNDITIVRQAEIKQTNPQVPIIKLPVFASKNISNYRQIISQPVFHATRQPSQSVKVNVTPTTDFIVTGVMISPEHKFAWIKNSKGQQIKVSQGKIVNRWFLEKIQKDGVFFRYGRHTLFVKLTKEKPKKK
jgi:hypothetical protein